MNLPHLIKVLRIVWSSTWGLLALSLLFLWWRSYWTLDVISRVNNSQMMTTFGSQMGTVYFAHFDAYLAYRGTGNSYASRGWTYRARDAYVLKDWFVFERSPSSLNINLPHWFIALFATLIGAVVWRPLRFSLRTLLIATTFVAILLATAAYLRVW